ncbi:MAG: hypothetical protein H0W88_09140 [Parachlamydiaceae bacterium]|nr:hypothetical protein [Parachlamydiaceae bacterium]
MSPITNLDRSPGTYFSWDIKQTTAIKIGFFAALFFIGYLGYTLYNKFRTYKQQKIGGGISSFTKKILYKDPLLEKLLCFNNPNVTGQINGIYITSNETNLSTTQKLLLEHPRSINDKSIHIGCAAWHNFDIMCTRKSNYGLIIDFNPENAKFINKTIAIINSCETRDDFKQTMINYLNSLEENERALFFHSDQKGIPTESIESELLRDGSWLQSDDNYSYIKEIVSQGHLIAITENITNHTQFGKIRNFLDENDIVIDTLYLSNISSFMQTTNDKNEYEKSVKQLLHKDTIFINCPKLKRFNPLHITILNQNPVLGNAVLATTYDTSQLFEVCDPITRATRLLEKALSCSAIRRLYETAYSTPIVKCETGNWKVVFAEKTITGSSAETDFSSRQITLLSTISDEKALAYLVFQLIFAVDYQKHLKLSEKALLGQIQCEDYAKERAQLDFEGTQSHKKIIIEAIKEMEWSSSLNIYATHTDFEKYWNIVKSTPTVNYYRNQFHGKLFESSDPIIRATKLLEKALFSKAIKRLYEKAYSTPTVKCKHGDWKIVFAEKTTLGFQAECFGSLRQINILSSLSDQMALTYLVFELTNATQEPRFNKLYEKARSGQIQCEEYTREIERIEFEGTLLHREIIVEAIKELGLSPSLNIYASHTDFEAYWNIVKLSPHSNCARKQWKIWRAGKLFEASDPITRATKLLEKALSCNAIKQLYEKAYSTPTDKCESGHWKIVFDTKTILNSGAETVWASRQITLLSTLSDETALTYFVFQLTNAIHFQRHAKLNEKARLGQILCEEYTKEIAQVNFDGTLIHKEIINEAIKEMDLSPSVNTYASHTNFETYWNIIKLTPSANFSRDQWKKLAPKSK